MPLSQKADIKPKKYEGFSDDSSGMQVSAVLH